MRTVAIIQARVGSSRLPGKVLADIGGLPLLWYVVHRAKLSRHLNDVIVATPDTQEDLAIHSVCAAWNVPCTCIAGDQHDVLTRYRSIVDLLDPAPSLIVRLTADCPFIDPDIVDATIEQLRNEKQWASNIAPRTWPDGLDVEVFTRARLEQLDRDTVSPADREHVTPLLYRGSEEGGVLEAPVALGDVRWTVDTQEDLEFARKVYARVPWRASWSHILFCGLEHRRSA